MHELADVIGHFLPPVQSSHKLPAYKLRALDALHKCRTPHTWADMWKLVRTADRYAWRIIAVATGTAPNVGPLIKRSG